jgi:hypothetical protein
MHLPILILSLVVDPRCHKETLVSVFFQRMPRMALAYEASNQTSAISLAFRPPSSITHCSLFLLVLAALLPIYHVPP